MPTIPNGNSLEDCIPWQCATIIEADSKDAPDKEASTLRLPYRLKMSEWDLVWAMMVGAFRCKESLVKHDRPALGCGEAGKWDKNINGAIAERALSLFLDKAWPATVNCYSSQPDVDMEEVRSTPDLTRRLYIKKGDDLSLRYWLVRGEWPVLEITGWIRGHEAHATEDKWNPNRDKKAKPTSYFIQTRHLKTYIPVMAKTYHRPDPQLQWPLNK